MKASWTYDGTQVNLLKNSDTGDVSNYIENGEWSLEELLVERKCKNIFLLSTTISKRHLLCSD